MIKSSVPFLRGWKKAAIVIKLVPESRDAIDDQIAKEIITEAEISWAAKIEGVTVSRKI
jgi:hypothetical protein